MFSKVKDLLHKPRSERRFERLIHMLQQPDWEQRMRAVEELGTLRDRRTVELLITALHDRESLVRCSAAHALADLGDPQAIEPLRAAYIVEADAYNRLWIGVAMAALGDTSALDHLFLDIAALDAEGHEDWDSAAIIAATLAGLGERALEPLTNALNHRNETVRWIAVVALGEFHDARATAALRHALHDVDPHVRAEAAHELRAPGAE